MQEQKEEKKRSAAAIVGTVIGQLVLVAVAVAAGWIVKDMWPKKDKAESGAAMAAAAAAAVQTVAVMPAKSRPYNPPKRYVAHVEAIQEVELLPQVDGYIQEIKFKEGDVVKAGQLLYVINDERYRAVVNQRKADLAAAEAEARRTQRYYERMQKADARGITQLERDNAEAGAESSKAAVLQAKANLVVAEYDLKKTVIVAPITGQIGKSSAHCGDYVAPSKGSLAKIVQIDPIRVTFPFTDRAYIAQRLHQKEDAVDKFRMRLLLADGSEYGKEGTWDFDDNQMSRETASIMMRLSFPNPDKLLVPNNYVTLLTDLKNPPEYLSVPQQAVFDLPGGSQGVWVVRPDNTVEQRVVETSENHEGWAPIMKGLKPGENVVISGISKLRPRMPVKIVTPTSNDDINKDHKSPIAE